MSFDALVEKMNQIESLAKALPAVDDDKKIEAAAGAEGQQAEQDDALDGNDGNADDVENKGKDKSEDEADDDGKPLVKSFALTLEDGSQLEAFDGTEMLKALTARVEDSEAKVSSVEIKTVQSQEQILKAMNVAVDLIASQSVALTGYKAALNEQAALVKSLQAEVVALANTGRGRVSTVTLAEKPGLDPTLAKSLPGMSHGEILAKAQSAHKSGRISGLEAAGIETRLNMGIAIQPEILSRIATH